MSFKPIKIGALVGFLGGCFFGAVTRLVIWYVDPPHPPMLLELVLFSLFFALFNLLIGAITAATTCQLVRLAYESTLWKRLIMGNLGVILLRYLEMQGYNSRSVCAAMTGFGAGGWVGAAGAFLFLVIAIVLSGGDIGDSMVPI